MCPLDPVENNKCIPKEKNQSILNPFSGANPGHTATLKINFLGYSYRQKMFSLDQLKLHFVYCM